MTVDRRAFLRTSAILAGAACLPLGARGARAATPLLRVQRLAWAGVRLQLDGASLFIDPMISPDVWGPALPDELVAVDVKDGARFVLVTHLHPDHFDVEAARKIIGTTGTLVCAAPVAAAAASRGFTVRAAQLYEPILLDDHFTVTPVPAVDGYGDPQVSWVVVGGGRRIIHCGDTAWHGAWWHIGRLLGPFDAAFLPINGARFKWRKPVSDIPAVLTPEQAAAAAVVLGARLVVPIHFGIVGADGYRETPEPVKHFLAAARARNVAVEVARPGQWLTWAARS